MSAEDLSGYASAVLQLRNNPQTLKNLTSEKSEVQVVDFLTGVAAPFKVALNEKGQSLAITANIVQVNIHKEVLAHILCNFLSNAIKYSPKASVITLGGELLDHQPSFFVRDEGPGIPVELAERIFEKLYRIRDERHIAKGSGLGLFLSKYFADVIGAKISAENVKPTGSLFRVTCK
jgi:K+-sensing histidine kinase KdpD